MLQAADLCLPAQGQHSELGCGGEQKATATLTYCLGEGFQTGKKHGQLGSASCRAGLFPYRQNSLSSESGFLLSALISVSGRKSKLPSKCSAKPVLWVFGFGLTLGSPWQCSRLTSALYSGITSGKLEELYGMQGIQPVLT